MNERNWMIISSKQKWFNLNLAELWKYRYLVMLLVRRDFVAVYKQTILGPCWFILQPLITSLVFTVVFSVIIGIDTNGVPPLLFFLSGVVLWNFFANCLNNTGDTLRANVGLFGKVYFPRLAVPCATVLVNVITFCIQFALLIVIGFYFSTKGVSVRPFIAITLVPLFILQIAALSLGTGLLFAALTTRYRDLSFLLGFVVQLWMFATPIIYPSSQIPVDWQRFMVLNPMMAIVENFRAVFLALPYFGVARSLVSIGVTLSILFLGLLAFSRVERTFVDRI